MYTLMVDLLVSDLLWVMRMYSSVGAILVIMIYGIDSEYKVILTEFWVLVIAVTAIMHLLFFRGDE